MYTIYKYSLKKKSLITTLLIILNILLVAKTLHGVYTKKLEIRFTIQNINDFTIISNITFLQNNKGISPGYSINNIFTGTEGFISWVEGTYRNFIFSTANPNNIYLYNDKKVENLGSIPNHSIVTRLRVIDNSIYILTGEKGAIYLLLPFSSNPLLFIDDSYVWDVFKLKGRYFIITGNNACIYEFRGKNIRKVFENKNEKHFLTVAGDENGVYIGSSGTGTIYFFDGENVKPLISLKDNEITDIKKYGEYLIVSTYNITPNQSQQTSQDNRTSSLTSPQTVLRNTQGNVYKISIQTKRIEPLFSELGITSAEVFGNKVFATTIDGKFIEYSLEDGTLKYSINNRNFVSIFKFSNEIVLSSANPSGLDYIDLSQSNFHGYIETREIEVGNVYKWGRIRYDGEIPIDSVIKFFIKGGNTPKEDQTWSTWTEIKEFIKLDTFQYIKLKVEIISKSSNNLPILRSVSLYYTPRNSRPIISSFSVSHKEDNLNFEWKSLDQDNDKLNFDIFVRNYNETQWQKLNTSPINDNRFSISRYTIGNGIFNFMLVASDYPSNPKGLELYSTNYIENYISDITPPSIRNKSEVKISKKHNFTEIEFEIYDNYSLKEVTYSTDGGNIWEYILPDDGVIDSSIEKFKFNLNLSSGVLVLKIKDEFDNISIERIPF
ncbi:MAG: hypothetical protein N2712_00415 [Brevinematales bacterium]|nr:hypothetical protein [Brevinematales bacterium]